MLKTAELLNKRLIERARFIWFAKINTFYTCTFEQKKTFTLRHVKNVLSIPMCHLVSSAI